MLAFACGDDIQVDEDNNSCQTVCLPLEVGVECHFGLGITKVQCGPDKTNAAFNCQEGNGVPGNVVPPCEPDGGNDDAGTTTGQGVTWDPLLHVKLEPTSATRIIDRDFFDLMTGDPFAVEADATVLRIDDGGSYFIAYEGELCTALGLERLDTFVSINGHSLAGFAAFADTFVALQGQSEFELTVIRDEQRVVLSYRVE
ncbi:MAG: hypothetical protein KC431_27175 [Myxococcales bacterium]|nr:hypothetical protein [Myxococcales bacterium]